jgi:hypothetical protein
MKIFSAYHKGLPWVFKAQKSLVMSSLQIEPAAKLLLHIFLSDFPLCAVIACSLLVGFYSRILSLMQHVGSLNPSGFSDMKESSSWKCIIPALQNDKTSCCNAALQHCSSWFTKSLWLVKTGPFSIAQLGSFLYTFNNWTIWVGFPTHLRLLLHMVGQVVLC